jgi:hypothetical protein
MVLSPGLVVPEQSGYHHYEMADEEYKTRHHELPLVRVEGLVAVHVPGTSDWFRRSVQPHLRRNLPVRIDAAPGYAYALHPREFDRTPVLARLLVLRWSAGRLYLDSARGTNGRPVDLELLLAKPSLDEIAEAALRQPTVDRTLTKSGLRPVDQAQIAETARQESALRLTLLAQVLDGDVSARVLCVKLLGTSFGGCDAHGDLYLQAREKLETLSYAPHLRDLLRTVISNPIPSAIRTAAIAFCQHLKAAGIEEQWAADLLERV